MPPNAESRVGRHGSLPSENAAEMVISRSGPAKKKAEGYALPSASMIAPEFRLILNVALVTERPLARSESG